MLAPWNESGAVEHLPFRSFAVRLAQTLYRRAGVIPLGIYIFSGGFSKAPSGHNEGGAFLPLTLGFERLALHICRFRSAANRELRPGPTHVTYKVVNFLKRHEGLDVYDYDTQFNPLLIGG